MYLVLIIGIPVLLTLNAFLIVLLIYRHTVMKKSSLIKELLDLNAKYTFNQGISERYIFQKHFPTKPQFDRFEIDKILDEVILTNPEFRSVLNDVIYNRETYNKYQSEINQLQSKETNAKVKYLNIPYSPYVSIEQHIFKKRQLKPILNFSTLCVAKYISPKGRNKYLKSNEYTTMQVLSRLTCLNRMLDLQNTEEMRRKQERAKMTDKLRYSILKRDGFRCKICGRTAYDGVKLHVDHIMPISKGGKTEYNNLQTLCESCNLGKSNTI